MNLKIDTDSFPRYCLEGQEILADKARLTIDKLTVSELEKLVKGWVYTVLADLSEPTELTPLHYSKKQAAVKLGLSVPTVDGLVKSGKLPARLLNRRCVILHDDLVRLLKDE